MSYAEIINCEEDKVKSLHSRCAQMLNDAAVSLKVQRYFELDKSHPQRAYNLYHLCQGIFFYSDAETFTSQEYKLPFESLEELELKLVMRGY